jgi:hypothetical protein
VPAGPEIPVTRGIWCEDCSSEIAVFYALSFFGVLRDFVVWACSSNRWFLPGLAAEIREFRSLTMRNCHACGNPDESGTLITGCYTSNGVA